VDEIKEILPDDRYDIELLKNVYPSDWKNPEPAPMYNIVVIGAGSAGLVVAAGAASLGAKVALIEKRLIGGDCLNLGCVPSKTIISSSRITEEIREASGHGVRVICGAEADFPLVMERMRRLRAKISRHDSAMRFREMGVDVFLGEGRFTGPDTVEVAGCSLRFKRAVIATGARPLRIPVEGLDEAGYLTNETVFNLTERPRRLAVLGGGAIGCELAQAFARLGSEVVVLQRGPRLMDKEDPDASAIIHRTFERDGIRIILGEWALNAVEVNGSEKLLHLEKGGEHDTVAVDELLVSVGRSPNVEGLGLDAAGVKSDPRNGIIVDDYLRTSNPRIYAAGDSCLMLKFTHTADAAARIVLQNALFGGRKRLSALTVPWCTFTDPEVAHVGTYEHKAEKIGIPLDTFTVPFSEVDRAVLEGEEEGFVRVHVKKGTDQILGATIVARHAGDMISELTLAMQNGIGLKKISGVIHPYPTFAEAIRHVADQYNRTRLTPRVKKLFSRWLALHR